MTTKLRETIRTMVRNEFATRILAEAEAESSAKTVYRSSKYIDIWKDIPMGKATSTVTSTPTKHDFVRRVMKEINKSSNSTAKIFLKPEYREKAISMLTPLMSDPDEFVETLNKERELIFGSANSGNSGGNLRSAPDPVHILVQEYLQHKDVLKTMEGAPVDGPGPAVKDDTEEEGEYDIIPGTTSKATVSRMLSQDPTETTTEMSVGNRLSKAMKHLSNDRNLEILEFIKDADMDKSDKVSIMSDLEKISSLAKKGLTDYSTMFVDSMIEAAKAVKDVENFDQLEKARTVGLKKFVAKLTDAGTFSKAVNKEMMNPAEEEVFDHVLDKNVGRHTVAEMLVIAAKKPASTALFRDEALATAIKEFSREMNRQTNFNTLGDYTDTLPEMKEVRANLFKTLEKRGRKPGSTKEVLAAQKAAKATK